MRDRGREGRREGETHCSVPGVAMRISMPCGCFYLHWHVEGGIDCSREVRAVRESKEGAME